jgi:alpha-tubulin suppressor-like RCC1 family protein
MRLQPVRASKLSGVKVTALRGGGLFTMVLTSTGKVLAWGNNAYGQLGDGTRVNRLKPVRVRISKGVTVTAISAGYNSALALTKSGRVLSWGGGVVGQLGNGSGNDRSRPGYVRLPPHTKITSIAAGYLTGYAATSTGRLLAWGYNFSGALGDGTTKNRAKPVQVRLPHGVKVAAATAGGGNALALTTDGRVLAWGNDMYGQLGNGSTTDRHIPVFVKLPRSTKIRALAAGEDFGMALTTAGRILAWGHNNFGQLGNGTTTNSATPVRVHLPPGFKTTGIGADWLAQTGLAIGNAPVAMRRAATHRAAARGGVAPRRAGGLGGDAQPGERGHKR